MGHIIFTCFHWSILVSGTNSAAVGNHHHFWFVIGFLHLGLCKVFSINIQSLWKLNNHLSLPSIGLLLAISWEKPWTLPLSSLFLGLQPRPSTKAFTPALRPCDLCVEQIGMMHTHSPLCLSAIKIQKHICILRYIRKKKNKKQPPRTSHNYLQPVDGMSANRLQVLIIFALSWTMLAMLWNFHLQTYDNVYVSRWHREHIILNSLALQHPHYCKLWPLGRVGPPLKQTLWNTEHLTIDEFLEPCPPKLIDIPNSPYEGLPKHWGRCWLHTHVYIYIKYM